MTRLNYLFLAVAIVCEVLATASLKGTERFTRLVPSVLTVAGYPAAFYFLSLTMKVMPTGVVYATWSGVGIVLISTIGWLHYRESLNLPTMLGLAMIVVGVVTVNLFSEAH